MNPEVTSPYVVNTGDPLWLAAIIIGGLLCGSFLIVGLLMIHKGRQRARALYLWFNQDRRGGAYEGRHDAVVAKLSGPLPGAHRMHESVTRVFYVGEAGDRHIIGPSPCPNCGALISAWSLPELPDDSLEGVPALAICPQCDMGVCGRMTHADPPPFTADEWQRHVAKQVDEAPP
jgi:hypothetical protein